MGRAFTLSLTGHAALILSFLLLSATRQPIRIVEPVRPIRLVTYIDPPAAPVSRPSRVVEPAVPSAQVRASKIHAERVAPRVAPIPARPRPERTPAPVAVAVPKIVIPTRDAAPSRRPAPAPPAADATLRERLSRRLAAASREEALPAEPPAPMLAALTPQQDPPAAKPAVPTAPTLAASLPTAQTPGTVLPLGDFPHAWYLTLLRDRVFAHWSPPSEPFLAGRAPVALVAFRIDRAGRVGRLSLKEGSGHARFDRSALSAVQSLGQAPALPEQYPEESLDVVIRFQNERYPAAENGPSGVLHSSRLTAAYNSYASFGGSSRALHLDHFGLPASDEAEEAPCIALGSRRHGLVSCSALPRGARARGRGLARRLQGRGEKDRAGAAAIRATGGR